MIKRARFRLAIEELDEEGAGVGTSAALGGRRLHVPFTLPGEQAVVEVEHESPHRLEAWGRLVELERPAAERVEASCAAWGQCGGCALQHLAYPSQRAFKRWLVERTLAGAAFNATVGECRSPVEPEHPSAPPRAWRNRSKLVFARKDDRVVLGAYAPRSHRVVDLAGCTAVAPPLAAVADTLAALSTALGVVPYDEGSATGDARYAILRAGRHGRTQVMLVVARRGAPGIDELGRRLAAAHPEVQGVVENLNAARGNVLIGHAEPDRVLAGAPDLVERVGDPDGVPIRLGPRAFFQASWAGADLLYRLAVERAALAPGESALDLYTGAGGIALLAARRTPSARIVGVEEVDEAVAGAEAARALGGIDNARFVRADVADFLAASRDQPATDVVFVDPPRRGLLPAVTAALVRLAPRRVVYVSCAPDTLARDLAILVAAGYRTGEVTPIDLMPDTAHVECVVALDR